MSKKFLALSLALATAGTALAAGTAADTKIRNQAIADFTDSNGQRQTTKSNEVLTVVQPVYNYSITPDQTSTGQTPARTTSVPNTGAPRYFAYYVTNTGNATDTITLTADLLGSSSLTGTPTFKLYYDSTPNGQVDSGEIEVTKVGGNYQVNVDADQTLNLVAEVRLPVQGTVVPGTTRADFNLIGDSTKIAGTGDETGDKNNTIRINVSNDAAFQVVKDASLADLVDRGGNLKYTIQGSNNGATAASAVQVTVNGATRYGILVEDYLPVNGSSQQLAFLTTALGTSAAASPNNYVYSGRGVAVPVYNVGTASAPNWSTTFSDTAVAVGILIQGDAAGTTDPGAFFQPGDQFTLVFNTRVDNDRNSSNTPDATILAVGTAINNTAAVTFKKNNLDGGTKTSSNTRVNHVAPAYAVAVGQDDNGTAAGIVARDLQDTQVATGNAYLGQTFTWTTYLTNNGNTTDNVKLSLDSASQLLNATLSYTNGTSITENDPISIGVGQTIAIRVTGTIPMGATVGSIASIRLLADSANVSGSIGVSGKNLGVALDAADSVVLESPAITNPYNVDGAVDDDLIVNNPTTSKTGDSNAANDSTNLATAPSEYTQVNPGTTAYYPVEIRNTGSVQDTYDLSVPAGAVLHTFTDTNNDGNWDVGEPVGSAISTTSPLNPGQAVNLVLEYPIASNQAPGNITVPVTATSATRPATSDSFNVIFVVQANNQVTFTPNREGSVVPGGVVEYTHTASNNGNTFVGFDLAAAGTSGTSDKGLIYTYSVAVPGLDPDGAGPLLPGDYSPYTINPGAVCLGPAGSAAVKVRVEAPSNVPIGTEDPEILTGAATFYTDSACTTLVPGSTTQNLSVTDTTTVVGTLIKVDKKVKNLGPDLALSTDDRDAGYVESNIAYPSDHLEYKLDAFNNGNLDIYGLVVSDKMPADTTFVNFTVSGFPAGARVFVSPNYDPADPSSNTITWVATSSIGNGDTTITAAEWAAAFPGYTFDTLFIGLDVDGDGVMEFTNQDDKVEPSQGATVLFRVKVK